MFSLGSVRGSQNQKKSNFGAVTVETAMLLPLFFLFGGGIFDWGLSLYTKHRAQNLAHTTARYATTLSDFTESLGDTNPDNYYAYVAAYVQQHMPGAQLFNDFNVQIFPLYEDPSSGLDYFKVRVSGTYKHAFLKTVGLKTTPIEAEATSFFEVQVPPQPLLMAMMSGGGGSGSGSGLAGGTRYSSSSYSLYQDPYKMSGETSKTLSTWSITDKTSTSSTSTSTKVR